MMNSQYTSVPGSVPNYGYVTSTPITHGIHGMNTSHVNNTQFGNSVGYGMNMGNVNNMHGGYVTSGANFPYNNQFFMSSGHMMTGTGGYSEVALPAESRMEYVPYESYYIDYMQQQYVQSVLVPYQKKGIKYIPVQHITDYVPKQIEETVVDMVPQERIRQRLQYMPVETHIVHFPDESKPLYKPKTHEYRANQTQMHEYSFNNKQNIAPSNSQLNQNLRPANNFDSSNRNMNINTINKHEFRSESSQNIAFQTKKFPPQSSLPSKIHHQNQSINQGSLNETTNLPPPPPPLSNFNNFSNISGHVVSQTEVQKTYEKYPPPHKAEGQLAGGSIKSHHRVVTSKPLNQGSNSGQLEFVNKRSSVQKKNQTMNLVNLANESVHQQMSTPSGSMHRNSLKMNSSSFNNPGNRSLPPPPPPPLLVDKNSSIGYQLPLHSPTMQNKISLGSSDGNYLMDSNKF